jgi:hypothetical protein
MARARGRRWRLEDLEQGQQYSLRWDPLERRWEVYAWGADEPLVTKPGGARRSGDQEATQERLVAPPGRHQAPRQ